MRSLVAIGPLLPQRKDLESFSRCLDFLKKDYHITWRDPLENINNLTYDAYEDVWTKLIEKWQTQFDVFVGFSLGAILLQSQLNQFLDNKKIIILVSPPAKLNSPLKDKLSNVLELVSQKKTDEALRVLQNYVSPSSSYKGAILNQDQDANVLTRLKFGLEFVLTHQFAKNSTKCETLIYQLVGEDSQLVTQENVLMTPRSICEIVPKAGMRVLEDNPGFSQAKIKEWLHVK